MGDEKDIAIEDLSKLRNKKFIINKTERVGNNLWYRGTLNGREVFLYLNWIRESSEVPISKLGHIKGENVKVYSSFNLSSYKVIPLEYSKNVFYIKSQINNNVQRYYLISTIPSSRDGITGWINVNDINSHDHIGIDTKPKTLLIKGIGHAYSKVWGGTNDITFENLSGFKNSKFYVNKTENVGRNIRYRGILNGKQVFIHENWIGMSTLN